MRALSFVLRAGGVAILLVGAIHLVLGAGADVLLGAALSSETLADPALDSQNRFYGVAFTLYGVLFLVCASDIARYSLILRCVIWVFFAAGCARIVSIVTHGVPPPMILALMLVELAAPPVLALWLSKVSRGS